MWGPSSYGSGPRHWYITRKNERGQQETAEDSSGRYRRFASYEGALAAAKLLSQETTK